MDLGIPTGLNKTERAVCAALTRLDKHWWRVKKTDGAWTRAIKNAVGSIGRQRGYRVYAASSKFERDGEWVFDLGWYEMRGEFIVDVPLALESEWTISGAMDDFQKLLISRAQNRVMVLWSRRRAPAEALVGSLIGQVGKYRGSRRGDRYLFCFWIENPPELLFHSHVVK